MKRAYCLLSTVELSKLNLEQLQVVKQQFDQELQHFQQSLQALVIAKNKFNECINDIQSISKSASKGQQILIPATTSLYIPGIMKDNDKFMVDVGTGYYVEKNAKDSVEFYQKKIDKLNQESQQIQKIIQEKSKTSLSVEQYMRQLLIKQAQEKNQDSANVAPDTSTATIKTK